MKTLSANEVATLKGVPCCTVTRAFDRGELKGSRFKNGKRRVYLIDSRSARAWTPGTGGRKKKD